MIARKVGPIVHDREVEVLNWRTSRLRDANQSSFLGIYVLGIYGVVGFLGF